MTYLFDEFDECYRAPNGAIPARGAVRLRIKFERGVCREVSVMCHCDGMQPRKTPMRFVCAEGSLDLFECELSFEQPDLYWLCFEASAADGQTCFIGPRGASCSPEGHFQVTVYDPNAASPDWVRGGVVYHIFVDRFYRGDYYGPQRQGVVNRDDWGGCPYFMPDHNGIVHNNDFFGGNLCGIIEKLPYLESLGVTCLYLSPIFEAASNHKYDTGDFMKVDPAFGNDEVFERLIEEAGRRGIRIMLDGVFSHVGVDSIYFNKYGRYNSIGAYQSKESPYFSWFNFFSWNNHYESWWGISLLPALNKNNQAYRDYICSKDGVIAHWSKKGVSGWRLDVVDELPDSFLVPLCDAVRREKDDALIIGEVWEDASNKIAYSSRRRYFLGGQLDGVTNYPLMNAIIAYVRDGDVECLANTMATIYQNYPEHSLHSLLNILGTHDTMRILTALGSDSFPATKSEMAEFRLTHDQLNLAKRRLRLAAVLQFLLPGMPCVYYGDEAGMEGGADPFNRRCYPWGGEDGELISWYKRLSRMKSGLSCFRDGGYKLIMARDGVFAFIRGEGDARALVAVNISDRERELPYDFNYCLLTNEYTTKPTVPGMGAAVYIYREQ